MRNAFFLLGKVFKSNSAFMRKHQHVLDIEISKSILLLIQIECNFGCLAIEIE